MRRFIVFSILICCSLNLHCQSSFIKGFISDSNNNLPIPYSCIFIKGTSFGTISNSDGRYVFYLPKTPAYDSIIVSCIGYSTKSFSLESIKDSIFNISLKASPILLPEVTVTPLNIKSILEKTLKNISENYPTKPSILKGVLHQSLIYPMFIPDGDQIICKTYMTRVEGENTRLRHYLARLHRKTLCYSKSKEMLAHSVRLLIHYLKFWDVPVPYSPSY